jgi:hypothetical protein
MGQARNAYRILVRKTLKMATWKSEREREREREREMEAYH